MNFDEIKATLDSEPIEGYLHTGEYVSIPLISHIVDNLYVGGHSELADLGDFFTDVFSLYVWGTQYATHEDTRHHSLEIYDSPGAHEGKDVEGFVDKVVEALEAGGNVLVHCQAGINRSNLTAALALRKWKGLNAVEAIELLRSKRSNAVLANRSFENYLLGLDDLTTHELAQAQKARLKAALDKRREDRVESSTDVDDNF